MFWCPFPCIGGGPGAAVITSPVHWRAQSGGNGMGLMFCQRVMQSIGGSIEIDSTPGAGTTISLYFKPS